MRAPGLRSGARKTLSPKRLRPYYRADLITVDVDVSYLSVVNNLLNPCIYPGVNTERQAVPTPVDCPDDLGKLVCAVGCHMQHRAEHFAIQIFDPPYLYHRGAHEVPTRRGL